MRWAGECEVFVSPILPIHFERSLAFTRLQRDGFSCSTLSNTLWDWSSIILAIVKQKEPGLLTTFKCTEVRLIEFSLALKKSGLRL